MISLLRLSHSMIKDMISPNRYCAPAKESCDEREESEAFSAYISISAHRMHTFPCVFFFFVKNFTKASTILILAHIEGFISAFL